MLLHIQIGSSFSLFYHLFTYFHCFSVFLLLLLFPQLLASFHIHRLIFFCRISHKVHLPILNTNLDCNQTKCQKSSLFLHCCTTSTEAPSQSCRNIQDCHSVVMLKKGGQVGDFHHQLSVLLPNRMFLSGEKWATLWEVVVLASIRGQLQCQQFWRHGKWSVVIIRVGPIHLPVQEKCWEDQGGVGLCSALSWPPTLPIVIKLLLFVCSLFFMLKGSFGAFQLVFVLAAASVRLHRKKIFGRNKERQRRRSAGTALIKGSVFGLN